MIIEEQYPHAVSGRFVDEQEAQKGITALLDRTALTAQQIKLLRPGDKQLSRKLEPESGRIFRTLLSAHLWTAVTGFFAGIALAWLMMRIGPGWAANSPTLTLIAFAWVGTLAGAMIGGFIALRPDREPLIMAARHSSEEGDWVVVAHCESADEKAAAENQLEKSSTATNKSL